MTNRKRSWWFSDEAPHGGWQRISDADDDPTFDALVQEPDDPPIELWRVLSTLTEPQRFVIHLRYGLGGCTAIPLEDIARMMNISNQAVSRLEQRALKRMREGWKTALFSEADDIFEQRSPEDEEEAGGEALDVRL